MNQTIKILRTVPDLRDHVSEIRQSGQVIALTPTMGSLHDGHISLVKLGKQLADYVVATIFVNPTQFGPNEDYDSYPRDEDADVAMLAGASCDAVFIPSVNEMYTKGFATKVITENLTDKLCGLARPGHFDGVTTIVAKLLNQAQADIAIFGEKDWQQLAVITRMARDLDIPTQIIGAPILREPDGLAMSSRNKYLSNQERIIAPSLNRIISKVAAEISAGKNIADVMKCAVKQILANGFSNVDYLEVRHAETLELVEKYNNDMPVRIFVAAQLGNARLIDNIPVS